MANEFYTPTGAPSSNTLAASATIRAESALVEAAFDKLPTMAGRGSEVVVANAGRTALTLSPIATVAATALALKANLINPILINPNIGTPSAGVATNLTGTATTLNIGGNAATVTTNANLTGAVTSTGNATILGSFTSANLAAALTDETGTGANVFATGPTITLPNATGLPLTTGVTGVLPIANGGTNATTAAAARTSLGAAASGANGDITSLTALASVNGGQLAGLRNRVINGIFNINQRAVSGTVTLAAGSYGHDRFKAGAGGCAYTFASSANGNLLTISAGTLQQVIEGANLEGGSFILSWTGTATGRVDSGSYGASGVVGTAVAGTNQTVEFGTGTLGRVQYELGAVATVFEQRPVGMELTLCQRYFEKSFDPAQIPTSGTNSGRIRLFNHSSTAQDATNSIYFAVVKRATPTMTQFQALGGIGNALFDNVGLTGGSLLFSALAATTASFHHWTASAEL